MKLSRLFLERPRVYPGGTRLSGQVEASAEMLLEYEPGFLSVKVGDGPRVCFAIGSGDWWVQDVPKPIDLNDGLPPVVTVLQTSGAPIAAAPVPAPTHPIQEPSRAQPQDEPWKKKNRR